MRWEGRAKMQRPLFWANCQRSDLTIEIRAALVTVDGVFRLCRGSCVLLAARGVLGGAAASAQHLHSVNGAGADRRTE